MDEKLQKIFIVNMAASGISVEMMADTVNMPKEKVLKIIEQNREIIQQKIKEKRQKENGERFGNKSKASDKNTNKVASAVKFKEEINKKEVNRPLVVRSNSKYSVFNDMRKDIMLGKPYNLELLKKLTDDIEKRSIYKKEREIIEALIEIYVELKMFTKAEAIVREIYQGPLDKYPKEAFINHIKKREISYNIMKLHKRGLTPDTISKELRIYTVDVISEIKQQKELDKEIMQMYEDGMSKEEIVELINVNIERINLALSSKASPNKNESDAR